MVKGVMSHHLLWFPDGTHNGLYEAPEAGGGAVAQGVCRGIIIILKSTRQIMVTYRVIDCLN